ncbi:hypothetical protein V6x_46160 [Gimesia chilikensis]|uniref:Uncharacterized protein n=1 Tax=Gimesia chilikensis TaxID=2605989 RepID=A0A517WI00_9PLAN|nr:hypothetical protein V6x_46160 [Gimesia chilikensis]
MLYHNSPRSIRQLVCMNYPYYTPLVSVCNLSGKET